MWTFAGLLVVAFVLWHWLRRVVRVLGGILAVVEASINRVAKRTGEAPISSDIDERIFP